MNGHAETMDIKVEPDAEEKKKWERRGIIYQITMGLCANVSVLGPAMGLGYSAVALGPLMAPTSDVRIDKTEANWVATASALGTPIGCVLSSAVMRRGRRMSMLATSILSIIGWLTIYMAENYLQIIVGRVISGLATGLASIPATVYIAEITEPKWRGTMVTWTSISIALGVLIVYIFGYIFQNNWRLVALMCSILPMVSVALILTVVPETPIWLRDRNRLDEALETLKKFRGIPKDTAAPPSLLSELRVPQKKKQNMMKHLLKRNAIVPLTIMLSYFAFQQLSGIFVIVYYAVNIIDSAGNIDPYLGAVLIGVTRLVGSLLVASISGKYGRRIPSIISGAGMTIFMGGLSTYLFLNKQGYHVDDDGVIPIVCILMYIFMSTIGFLVIPFAMVGEIYPTKVKDILGGVTTCVGYVISSITIKTYPDMVSIMGNEGVFFFFAGMSLVGTIFVTLCLPETKGKTLREIEDMYVKRKRKPDDLQEKESTAALKDVTLSV